MHGAKRIFQGLEQTSLLDLTHVRFLKHSVIGVLIFIGISLALSVIPAFNTLAISLLASSGIAIAIVGIACQQLFSNIISGIFIQLCSPFTIGDILTIKNATGKVEDMTLYHIILLTPENKKIIVPNALFNTEVVEVKHP